MFDLVKKALFTGVGLASLTKEKIEELGKDLSRHAELSEAEAARFQAELESRASAAQQELRSEIDRRVEQVMMQLGVAKSEETANLSAKIAALTTRIDALEQRLNESAERPGTSDQG